MGQTLSNNKNNNRNERGDSTFENLDRLFVVSVDRDEIVIVQSLVLELVNIAESDGLSSDSCSCKFDAVIKHMNTVGGYSTTIKYLLGLAENKNESWRRDLLLLQVAAELISKANVLCTPPAVIVVAIHIFRDTIKYHADNLGDIDSDSLSRAQMIISVCRLCQCTIENTQQIRDLSNNGSKNNKPVEIVPSIRTLVEKYLIIILFGVLRKNFVTSRESSSELCQGMMVTCLTNILTLIEVSIRYAKPSESFLSDLCLHEQGADTLLSLPTVWPQCDQALILTFEITNHLPVSCIEEAYSCSFISHIETFTFRKLDAAAALLKPICNMNQEPLSVVIPAGYAGLNTLPSIVGYEPSTTHVELPGEIPKVIAAFISFSRRAPEKSLYRQLIMDIMSHTENMNSMMKHIIFQKLRDLPDAYDLLFENLKFLLNPANEGLSAKYLLIDWMNDNARLRFFCKILEAYDSLPGLDCVVALMWKHFAAKPPVLTQAMIDSVLSLFNVIHNATTPWLVYCASIASFHLMLVSNTLLREINYLDVCTILENIVVLVFHHREKASAGIGCLLKQVLKCCALDMRRIELLQFLFTKIQARSGEVSAGTQLVLDAICDTSDTNAIIELWSSINVSKEIVFLVNQDHVNSYTTTIYVVQALTNIFRNCDACKYLANKVNLFIEQGHLVAARMNSTEQCIMSFAALFSMLFDGNCNVSYDAETGFRIFAQTKLVTNPDAMVIIHIALESIKDNVQVYEHVLDVIAALVTSDGDLDNGGSFIPFQMETEGTKIVNRSVFIKAGQENEVGDAEKSWANATSITIAVPNFASTLIQQLPILSKRMAFVALQIVTLISRSYMSVRELKALMRHLLTFSNNPDKKDLSCAIVRLIQFTFESGTTSSVYFDGNRSGIMVNMVKEFKIHRHTSNDVCELHANPSTGWTANSDGVTFFTRVKLLQQLHHATCLAELRNRTTNAGFGLCVDEQGSIMLRVYTNSVNTYQMFHEGSHHISIDKWHTIGVVLRNVVSSGYFSNSSAQYAEIYVDGVLCVAKPCTFLPFAEESLVQCWLGSEETGSNKMHGCFASTQLWSTALSRNQILHLHRGHQKKVKIPTAILNFDAWAFQNGHFVDIRHQTASLRGVGCMVDKPATRPCFAKGSTNAILAIGGTVAILPILALEGSGELFGAVCHLLGSILLKFRHIRDLKTAWDTVIVVVYVLEHIRSHILDPHVVRGVLFFVNCLKWNKNLYRLGLEKLVMNLNIWYRAMCRDEVLQVLTEAIDSMITEESWMHEYFGLAGVVNRFLSQSVCDTSSLQELELLPDHFDKISSGGDTTPPLSVAGLSTMDDAAPVTPDTDSYPLDLATKLELFGAEDDSETSHLLKDCQKMLSTISNQLLPASRVYNNSSLEIFFIRVVDNLISSMKQKGPTLRDMEAMVYILANFSGGSTFAGVLLHRVAEVVAINPRRFMEAIGSLRPESPNEEDFVMLPSEPVDCVQIILGCLVEFMSSNVPLVVCGSIRVMAALAPVLKEASEPYWQCIVDIFFEAISNKQWNNDDICSIVASILELAVNNFGVLVDVPAYLSLFAGALRASDLLPIYESVVHVASLKRNCRAILNSELWKSSILGMVDESRQDYMMMIELLSRLVVFDISNYHKGISPTDTAISTCLAYLPPTSGALLMQHALTMIVSSVGNGVVVSGVELDLLASMFMIYFEQEMDVQTVTTWVTSAFIFLRLLRALGVSPLLEPGKTSVLHTRTCSCDTCLVILRMVVPVFHVLSATCRKFVSTPELAKPFTLSINNIGSLFEANVLTESAFSFALDEIQKLLLVSEQTDNTTFEQGVVQLLTKIQRVQVLSRQCTSIRFLELRKLMVRRRRLSTHGSRHITTKSIATSVAHLIKLEVTHRFQLECEHALETKQGQVKWTTVLKLATTERGTFGNAHRRKAPYLKLDFYEGLSGRCRFRIRPNESGHDHHAASIRSRDNAKHSVFVSEDIRSPEISLLRELQEACALGENYFLANWSDNQSPGVLASISNDSSSTTTSSQEIPRQESSDKLKRDRFVKQQSEQNLERYKLGLRKGVVVDHAATMVVNNENIPGRLLITEEYIKFIRQDPKELDDGKVRVGKQWSAQQCRRVQLRRYNMVWNALEIMTGELEKKSYFFAFETRYACLDTVKAIARLIHQDDALLSPLERASRSGAVQAWVSGNMTNFDYLMCLNDFAGRSFADLAQYPIFPWVLCDYESSELDLKNPNVFRDLRYPIGAQSEMKREILQTKYEETQKNYNILSGTSQSGGYWPLVWFGRHSETSQDQDNAILLGPPWHYGSHYSSRGIVVWYLLRLEPFTTYHIDLQDGKFDHADRQFGSIATAFKFATELSPRELIPEIFCNSEFLRNSSNYDLGTKQDGTVLGDVVLPPWCNGSPELFIMKHREALESEYVSRNLHFWIDLVFGYRQQGPAAVEMLNVYFHLMYEGAVDLPKLQIVRPDLFLTVNRMIEEYGQSPPILFQHPHPSKDMTLFSLPREIKLSKSSLHVIRRVAKTPFVWMSEQLITARTKETAALISLQAMGSLSTVVVPIQSASMEAPHHHASFIMLNCNGCIMLVHLTVGSHPSSDDVTVHELTRFGENYDHDDMIQHVFGCRLSYTKDMAFAVPPPFKYIPDLNGTNVHTTATDPMLTLFGGRFWESIVRSMSMNLSTKMIMQSIHQSPTKSHRMVTNTKETATECHSDACTCLVITEDGKYMVTGSKDCCVSVWKLIPQRQSLMPQLKHILLGHDDVVLCVAANSAMDTVVSISEDGTCNVYSLENGVHLCSMSLGPVAETPMGIGSTSASAWIGLCPGFIPLIQVWRECDFQIQTFSINGRLMASAQYPGVLLACAYSYDGRYIVCAWRHKSITVYDVASLRVVEELGGFASAIRSISSISNEYRFVCGLEDGSVAIFRLSTD